MRTIRRTKNLVKKRSIKKRSKIGGSSKSLKLGIKDERGEEIFVPVEPDEKTGQLEYVEDKSGIDTHTGEKLANFAQLRTNSPLGAPVFKKDWLEIDKTAIKYQNSGGGKRLKKRRKTKKSKRKLKKSSRKRKRIVK